MVNSRSRIFSYLNPKIPRVFPTDFREKEDWVLVTDSNPGDVSRNIFVHFYSFLIRPLERTSTDNWSTLNSSGCICKMCTFFLEDKFTTYYCTVLSGRESYFIFSSNIISFLKYLFHLNYVLTLRSLKQSMADIFSFFHSREKSFSFSPFLISLAPSHRSCCNQPYCDTSTAEKLPFCRYFSS